MTAGPYYRDERATLYHGDHRAILPILGQTFDLIVADPPYGETSLAWDRWPQGWPNGMTAYARSMWYFGSMRMFLDRSGEFVPWRLSQDVIWEKHNGSGFATDRFKRVHEHALHWYRGDWADIHHNVPRVPSMGLDKSSRRRTQPDHTGQIGNMDYVDDGLRLTRSVIYANSVRDVPINETQKPIGVLVPLISYACPPSGLVLDPFAGSCSTLVAARLAGCRAIGIELREEQCEKAAKRLAAEPFDFGEVSA